ncbi:hypothetical protein BA195_10100 [Tenacibaculum soleae]|uniref:Uncharacterized protein n=1 Tax=Tenacibaculum soleae TaxID=447689 RepID=A0A1B9XY70_9FLAO|nr:hypothetical protein [Tenacibaculum soleae]OCK42518.1 hypothetical protein BA195_10100 [Tenacibaculum soleae]
MINFKKFIIPIILLVIGLFLYYLYNKDNSNKDYLIKILELKELNNTLVNKNDSIKLINIKLDEELENLNHYIIIKEDELFETNKKLETIVIKKNNIKKNIQKLNIEEVDEKLTDYLDKRNFK